MYTFLVFPIKTKIFSSSPLCQYYSDKRSKILITSYFYVVTDTFFFYENLKLSRIVHVDLFAVNISYENCEDLCLEWNYY